MQYQKSVINEYLSRLFVLKVPHIFCKMSKGDTGLNSLEIYFRFYVTVSLLCHLYRL